MGEESGDSVSDEDDEDVSVGGVVSLLPPVLSESVVSPPCKYLGILE